ncbi:hypothetical protein D3C87_2154380 [compost metagenome]
MEERPIRDVLRDGEPAAANVEFQDRIVDAAALKIGVQRELRQERRRLLQKIIAEHDVFVDQHHQAEGAERG